VDVVVTEDVDSWMFGATWELSERNKRGHVVVYKGVLEKTGVE
jgi:hypothetical protein